MSQRRLRIYRQVAHEGTVPKVRESRDYDMQTISPQEQGEERERGWRGDGGGMEGGEGNGRR
jgi:hypothetical protein